MKSSIITLLLLAASPAAADELRLAGKIKEVAGGPTGRAILVTADGDSHTLAAGVGILDTELRRLAGLSVAVHGEASEGRVLVHRYELLDDGLGGRPRLGLLAQLELEGKARLVFVDEHGLAELLPDGWTKKMGAHLGARIWIVGERAGGVFRPARFGVLRAAASKEATP